MTSSAITPGNNRMMSNARMPMRGGRDGRAPAPSDASESDMGSLTTGLLLQRKPAMRRKAQLWHRRPSRGARMRHQGSSGQRPETYGIALLTDQRVVVQRTELGRDLMGNGRDQWRQAGGRAFQVVGAIAGRRKAGLTFSTRSAPLRSSFWMTMGGSTEMPIPAVIMQTVVASEWSSGPANARNRFRTGIAPDGRGCTSRSRRK